MRAKPPELLPSLRVACVFNNHSFLSNRELLGRLFIGGRQQAGMRSGTHVLLFVSRAQDVLVGCLREEHPTSGSINKSEGVKQKKSSDEVIDAKKVFDC